MPKKASRGDWQRWLDFKSALIQRDPLGREVIDYVLQHSKSTWERERSDRYRSNIQELERKYWCHVYIPEVAFAGEIEDVLPEQGQTPILVAAGCQDPVTWSVNRAMFPSSPGWLPFPARIPIGKGSEVDSPEDAWLKPPTLICNVVLQGVTLWDLKRLASDFKRGLRHAIKNLPDQLRVGPPELDFLRTVTEQQFIKDLRRYDLHMTHGLTFRFIADLESQGKLEGEFSEVPRQRRVGHPVPAESSVEDSVGRVYRAIHRALYIARRRRLDQPAAGVLPFSCPEHQPTCPGSGCKHFETWWQRVQPTLPSEKTGLPHLRKRLPVRGRKTPLPKDPDLL